MKEEKEIIVKEELILGMSHEIRTAMNDIVGFAAIAGACIQDQDRVKECLIKIAEVSDRLIRKLNESMEAELRESGETGTGGELCSEMDEVMGKIADSIDLSGVECNGKRVLLVEDNELSRRIIKELIEFTGALVECAESGEKAIAMVEHSEEGYYNLIFMDIQMAGMNGYDTTRSIRRLARRDVLLMPVIAMSANALARDIQQAREAGMNEHVAKPVDMGRLLAIIKKWA